MENKLPFQMTNHEIGCELECYVEILIYRGYDKEAKQTPVNLFYNL